MKFLILSFLILSTLCYGQVSRQVGWMSKFGMAGGLNASWMFPGYEDVNSQLPDLGISEKFEGGLLTWGGSGYVYLMIIDDVRIGGTGFGGSSVVSSNDGGYNKEVEYGIGGGAFSIEYTLPFIKRIAVSVGGMFGAGKVTIDVYQNNSSFSWQNTWNEFNNSESTSNTSRRMKNNYLTATPMINIDVPLTRFLAIRFGTGYQFSFNQKWTIENNQDLSGVPSSLNGDAFYIQTGIYLGFFAY